MLSRRVALHAGLAVVAALVAVWAAGRSARLAGIAEERARIAEERETIAVTAYHATRDSIPVLQAERERAERVLRTLRIAAASATARADSVSTTAHAVLADSMATAVLLRRTLGITVVSLDSLSAAFREYIRTDITVHEAHRSERNVLYSALSKADTALAASQRVSAAWKQAATCRVLWVPCPTRTQAFLGGVIVTAAAVVALR